MMLQVYSGSTRITICIWRWAFKVPNFRWGWKIFLQGLMANMEEREWQHYGAETAMAKLCVTLWGVPGGFLNCFPRAQPLTPVEFADHYQESWCYHVLGGERYDLPVEPKPDSFGWVNGRILAIDYGDPYHENLS